MPPGKTKCRRSPSNCSKRIKLDIDLGQVTEENITGFMTLSDDVLLIIFSRLEPQDLLSLSKCCRRFEDVTRDRTLWEHVDFRSTPYTSINLKEYMTFFQVGTKSIATCGPALPEDGDPECLKNLLPSISESFLRSITKQAPNLTTLILENHIIDSTKLLLEDFPASLLHLTIKKCVLKNIATEKSYFFKIDKALPQLKFLDLSYNQWFIPHSLLALSKSQSLEELNLSGCDVGDCLPYASLAANFGFCNLKVLDLRFTFVSDIEVSCFNRTATLRHLFLECPTPATNSNFENNPGAADVTDYSITTFGGSSGGARGHNDLQPHHNLNIGDSVIIIEVGSYPRPPCHLETLVLRGYPGVTDVSLKHAASFLKNLKFLDVTDSGCTASGILQFKKDRPGVTITFTENDTSSNLS